ncbi:Protein of unknown function [Cotesia congregata]|uniref:ATP synthase F(0) complex subunit e, mitochondrial n=1 Tax=Cotesia congregata TaxID=51543 RepID=A0A8J2H333_COTCN|nr:Protein of unknown function [Cotesia congregata]
MSAVELNPRPVRVSPLIKESVAGYLAFSRWTLLTAGIMYGLFYQNRFSKKEAAFQEVEMKRKAIRDKQLAEEKKRLAEGGYFRLFCIFIIIIISRDKCQKSVLQR